MGNSVNEKVRKDNHKTFVFAGVLLAAVMMLSVVLTMIYHARSEVVYANADNASQYLHDMNEELLAINRNILMIISDSGNKEDLAQDIDNSFDNIDYFMEQYSQVAERSDRELYRYGQANAFIKAYQKKFNKVRNDLDSIDTALYVQEIHPLQTTASEMLNATIDINVENREVHLNQLLILFYGIIAIVITVLVISEVGIVLFARSTDNQNEKLRKKEEEFEKVQSMLSLSKKSVSDDAKINPITNIRNRYGLTEDIEKGRFGKDFSMAVFNIDNFKYVNETFGYEYGDEYLSLLSKALKDQSDKYTEIYNYTSNSFCFVFIDSDDEAFSAAKSLHDVMEKSYVVTNIDIKQTVSGCFFHVSVSKSVNVNNLLKDAENSIRQTKLSGGHKLVKL